LFHGNGGLGAQLQRGPGQSPWPGEAAEAESFLAAGSPMEQPRLSFLKVLCSVQWIGLIPLNAFFAPGQME